MSLIGKKAHIKANIDSIHADGWGIIVAIEYGEMYHIAMWGDNNDVCTFKRNEFVVHREK